LVWPLDVAREIHLVRAADGSFATEDVERPLTRQLFRAQGEIVGSLYQSARGAGLPAQSLAEMIALLSWDLDLQREVHAGDRFETVLERRRDAEGNVVAYGDLVYVGLDTRERTIAAYRFTGPDGQIDFFDRDGRALRKWLLRTPVDGARLSSEFGPRRHPVLGYTRMHKGIDFAAPPGTPILAAGEGVVAFVGRNRGYGNYVKLRHNGEYDTAYAHLSRFAKDLKRGRRVSQGEVIGYVGSTGLSTGPHLHYSSRCAARRCNASRPIAPASTACATRSRVASGCWPSATTDPRAAAGEGWTARRRRAPLVQAATATGVLWMTRPSSPASTRTGSPSPSRPSRSISASGSCSERWITRLSGRAP
jgi:murein DD-endopeptidase MepM/ murein hydrolase activator NlpD